MAAAIAGRTSRLAIVIAALLAPLNDPVKVAEELAALDLASRGRVTVVIGAGYRDEECATYGSDRARRGPLVEEFVETLRNAWSGEAFSWRLRTVRVTPRPLTHRQEPWHALNVASRSSPLNPLEPPQHLQGPLHSSRRHCTGLSRLSLAWQRTAARHATAVATR